MKDDVISILESALAGAEDNLCRANMEFGRMSSMELSSEYYQSGKTRLEILEDYRARKTRIKACIDWVNTRD